MILSSEMLTTFDACERRWLWMRQYQRLRLPPLGALYRALDAGLTGEKEGSAGDLIMSLAAHPGLDVAEGFRAYDVAVHYAHLAMVLATFLRGKGPPWVRVEDVSLGRHTWHSACYEAGAGRIRRVALIDYWSDERRDQELRGWRTQGEIAALGRPLILNAVSIGHVLADRRTGPWTRAWAHPTNHRIRFRRKATTEGFSTTWQKVWRESSDLTTAQWIDQMAFDHILNEVVHTVLAEVPARVEDVREDMRRIALVMEGHVRLPPMRRAGCYGFSPCPFLGVCYGHSEPVPSLYGFRKHSQNPGPEPGPESPTLVQVSKNGLMEV